MTDEDEKKLAVSILQLLFSIRQAVWFLVGLEIGHWIWPR